MVVNKHIILVRIDKSAQKAKQAKTPAGIIIPEQFLHMAYNLQYGEIVQIGSLAAQNYPAAEVGDVAIFHHTIEDGPERIMEKEENGDELRWIDASDMNECYEIYAILKGEGVLIPSRRHIFLNPRMQRVEWKKPDKLIIPDADLANDPMWIRTRLEELEAHRQSLGENFDHLKNDTRLLTDEEIRQHEPAMIAINSILEEKAALTRLLNRRRMAYLQIAFINEETEKELGIGAKTWVMLDERQLYPLEVGDHKFVIIERDAIWAYKN